MNLTIPKLALVVLIGASGSGKTSFGRAHFRTTEVLSSDVCRGLVADDENDQSATGDAFDVLHYIAAKRLRAGRLTVVDATNVQPEARRPLVALAREHDVLPVAIVFNLPERICQERNRARPDRDFGPHVVRRQCDQLRRSLRALQREGFRQVHVLSTPEEVAAVTIERQPLWTDRRHELGPFDIIGDVHGCFPELVALLRELGYAVEREERPDDPAGHSWRVTPPSGRRVVFLGDLVDRGPQTPEVLRLAMAMARDGAALCVPGNHDRKLLRKLRGRDVQITHGLAESLEQLAMEPPAFVQQAADFLDGLISHYVLDEGRLVVAHAGMKEAYQGRASSRVREFALFGETTGETDEWGLPVRYNWAAEYRGAAMVVYGHTPVPEPEWLNRTINIDTGCVFGGRLTALRYPERELVAVPAARTYADAVRPLVPVPESVAVTAQQRHDALLDLADVTGKRIVSTRLQGKVTIREENAAAALEVMSRFAVDPRWLIYLPPTMSPPATTLVRGLLEHPDEAFGYYREAGVPELICEAKHMGSRAVVIVCRDADAARRHFCVEDGAFGICYTRTGRRFFDDAALEAALLARLRDAVSASGLWDELATEWLCLDCELLPWSAKAEALVQRRYASVGAAARMAFGAALPLLETAAGRSDEARALLDRTRERAELAERYTDAYRRYCWPVAGIDDLKLAPFQLLAGAGTVYAERSHLWHMETLARLCSVDSGVLLATSYRIVDLSDAESMAAGVRWWENLTDAGGEGMVVKPTNVVARGPRGLLQPAIKCRGREYLRIIYGPEYTLPEQLERLRQRGLSAKRSLALRELALGMEALERFTRGEPLRRVHECVFGVLALESEPVDPRL